MTNNWYFTKDISKLPLVMTTTTAISLTKPFANSNKLNSNITLYCLNPLQFQNPNFQHFPEKTGYNPKWLILSGVSTPIYWYASKMKYTGPKPTQDFVKQLIFLGNTKVNQEGRELQDIKNNNTKSGWGNPFYHRFLERTADTSYTIYFSTTNVTTLVNALNGTNNYDNVNFTEVSGPLIYTLTYNPAKDTGQDNIVYLVPTIDQNNMNPTDNENLKFHGFPLPILLWGWTDWVKN